MLSKLGGSAGSERLHLHRTRFELADEMGVQQRAFEDVMHAEGI
jgi:hypothetical protein